jgi:hypothetical protein
MKLCLLLAVGAFATQDVTPPVISLSLYGHQSLDTGTGNQWTKGSSSASRACIVKSTSADLQCPNPTCHVTDHHDGNVQCDPAIVEMLTKFTRVARTESTGSITAGTLTDINRNELGQYLLTYKARDASLNEADEIVFSFLFLDPFTPAISFQVGEATTGYSNENNGWAHTLKSGCSMGVYDESCLHISTSENSWGYSYSSKISATSGAVTGAVYASASFGKTSFVAPRPSNAWTTTLATTNVNPSANLESGFCNQKFGEASAHLCSRSGNTAQWVFDGSATATDNYRSSSTMTVYMKVDHSSWQPASTHTFCMINQPTFVVHWYVDDLAQAFGYKSNSNPQVHRVQLDVSDNTRPRIMATAYGATTGFAAIVTGTNGVAEVTETQRLECGKHWASGARGNYVDQYVEAGAEIDDNSDGKTCTGRSAPILRCVATGNAPRCSITDNIDHINGVNGALSMNYWVKYNYDDKAGNSAYQVTRPITVSDTTAPELHIHGDCTLENSAGANINAGGSNDADNQTGGLFDKDRIASLFDHRDHCIRDIQTTVTIHTGRCQHVASTSSVAKCTGTAVGPKITGTFLAKFSWAGVEYTSGYAGNARGSKESGTQVFPEYEAGTYAIQYTTTDRKHTVTACRQIENVDHTHPIIQILGSDVMTLEATHQGNYIDDGATCSDQVDGVISQNVEVSGDVVNLSKVGTYTITYNCKDSANNAAPPATRTVVVAQTSCPKCTVHGQLRVLHEASFPYTDAGASCSDVIDGPVTTHCESDNSKWAADKGCDSNFLIDISTTSVYMITYTAQNTVGLWNNGNNCRGGANIYTRKVTVSDTLRPVITLRYQGVKVAQGTRDATGDDKSDSIPANRPNTLHRPAGLASGVPSTEFPDQHTLPTLMAEETTSSVNGWVLGAIASAVAGLALLGYSTRRTAVATSVPV